jgi:DNA-binding helix-hairpin-helix protein with protein kinase domain
MRLNDHLNQPILLGEELGQGGEGLIYTIQGDPTNVAKIYHKLIAVEKAEKLRAMVSNNLDLSRFTAWPSATLHDQKGNTIKGFVMPRIAGHREVHELYGPAHRKVQFPGADWAFLIHAARNIAAAFQAVHDCSHTIGDVNQSGILISQQAVCRLIDTDSFQIRLGNKVYSCDVGTPHFTPPELQGKSFRGILRTENHDNFGLAVIIFQLLFMGRHPFAGRYSGSDDMSIERAIKEYRFAFGSRASTKQMAPPPNVLDISVCTSTVVQLFESAFSEESIQRENRPRAQEWVSHLDTLRNDLRSCNQNSVHKYHKSLSSCPWCRLENTSGTVYFLAYTNNGAAQSNFNLGELWSKIQAVKMPFLDKLPDIDLIRTTPIPLPEYAKPPKGILGFVNFFFNFHDDRGEHDRRKSILSEAEKKWQSIEIQWQSLSSDSAFSSAYQRLQNAYTEYKNLPNHYQAERKEILLKVYLERYFIENAEIANIGKKRSLILRSYGIETAADISYNKVLSIPTFGQVLTQNLVAWRNSLEIRFQQYKSSPQDLAALNSVDQKYAHRRSELEITLIGGKSQLEHSRNTLIKKREQVRKEAESVAKKLAQARADMKVYT